MTIEEKTTTTYRATSLPGAPMSAGAWARDIARTYDALAENFESRPSTTENTLGAIANRAEAAKYHSIAARMDATGVSDRVAQQPDDL